jgi:hypothetical protein
VRKHRLADHIPDGINRRLGRPARRIDLDEAARVHFYFGAIEPWDRRVRPATDRNEHAIERTLLRYTLGRLP